MNGDRTSGTMPEDTIFALDIGTRTIIGIAGVQENERFLVQAAEITTHESRAMVDGQIHDIAKVAEGVKRVKKGLESKLGYELKRVSIAAAGRVLKTCRVKAEREIEEGREIDTQFIAALEMLAIQKAQGEIEKLLPDNEKNQFYCVGYSVVNYFLDDYIIANLAGHKGVKAGVDILATFLPHMVVDSLYSVIERNGLEVTHLTLEPIAALNVAIPHDLRLLNLALVDIGAGTSDIAITKSGTVVAYAMVPVAGDEMTEAIAQHYLVDFNSAEKIKVSSVISKDPISFKDILDNEITVKPEEVDEVLRPAVSGLARTIGEKILEFNGGKAPNAVFLVGGGSQVHGLSEAVSEMIGLPKERVAVRNRSIARNIIFPGDQANVLSGPESITPLGIMVTTAMDSGHDFFYVTVNGNKVRMYNSRKMYVSDALILAGFDPEQLLCRSGKSLKFTVNSANRTVRGGFGKPSEIYLNHHSSRLNAMISPGDELTVVPAEKGGDAACKASDLINDGDLITLTYNEHTVTIDPQITVNGAVAPLDTAIQNGDRVEINGEYTLEEIAGRYEMDPCVWELSVNGSSDKKTVVRPGDRVTGKLRSTGTPLSRPDEKPVEGETKRELPDKEMLDKRPDERLPDKEPMDRELPVKGPVDKDNPDAGITVAVNGKTVNLPAKNTDYIFIDVFNHIDFDLTSPRGIIVLKLNGRDANYTDLIKTGDSIELYWREQ